MPKYARQFVRHADRISKLRDASGANGKERIRNKLWEMQDCRAREVAAW